VDQLAHAAMVFDDVTHMAGVLAAMCARLQKGVDAERPLGRGERP
jgi:hypothetical protein